MFGYYVKDVSDVSTASLDKPSPGWSCLASDGDSEISDCVVTRRVGSVPSGLALSRPLRAAGAVAPFTCKEWVASAPGI